MEKRFLSKLMIKNNLWLLRCTLLFIVISLVILFFSKDYVANCINGPIRVDSKVIESDIDLTDEYVTVRGKEIWNTGLQYWYNDRVKTEYFLLQMGHEKFIIVAVPAKEVMQPLSLQYTGKFEDIPMDVKTEINKVLIGEGFTYQEINDLIYPQMLDAEDYKRGFITLLVFLGAVLIVSLFFILKAVANSIIRHPIQKAIKNSNIDGIEEIIERDAEMGEVVKSDIVYIGRSWLLIVKLLTATFIPMKDVVWVYKRVVQHRVNGIRTHDSYELCIHTAKKQYKRSMKAKYVDQALEFMIKHAPWIIYGYTDEIYRQFKHNKEEFIRTVSYRAAQYNGTVV